MVSPTLVKLSKEFEKLDTLVVGLNKNLKALTVDTSGMRSLTTATNAANRAFEKANVSASALKANMASIAVAGRAMGGGIIPVPVAGGRGGGGGGHYNGIHGGNVHVGPKGLGVSSLGFAAGDMWVPIAGGMAAYYGSKSLFEAATSVDTAEQRFRLFGMPEPINQEAFRYAKNNKIFGTSYLERVNAMGEAQGVFRESGLKGSASLAAAKLAMPMLAQADFLASTLDEQTRATLHAANLNMLRYIEESGGLQSPEKFRELFDFGYKLNVSSGGAVDWAQLRQFKARAKVGGMFLTDDAMARLEPNIAALKGGATGFGLSTAYGRVGGMVRLIPAPAVKDYLDSGLWDRDKVIIGKGGSVKAFPKGNPMSADKAYMFSTNPELAYETYVRPWYDKKHFDFVERARRNNMMFGSTGGYNATLWEKNIETIHRSVESLKTTLAPGAAASLMQSAPSGQEKEFESAWFDFKSDFGKVMLPRFTSVLRAGSSILRDLDSSGILSKGVPLSPGGAINSLLDNGYMRARDWFTDGLSGLMGNLTPFGPKPGTTFMVNADAKKMGITVTPVVTKEQGKRLSTGDQTGPSSYDPTAGRIPSGSSGP